MPKINVLSIVSLQFRLPDDFDGGISDALVELSKYHNSAGATSIEPIKNELYGMPLSKANTIAFDNFIDAVRSGKRLLGLFKVSSCEVSDVEDLDG